MHTQTQVTSGGLTLFGWLVAQEARAHRGLQLLVLRPALRRAYARFAATHRELADSLFDDHFVQTRVAPMLAQALDTGERLGPQSVAEAWFESFKAPGSRISDAALAPMSAAAARLLACVEQELRPVQRQAIAPAVVSEHNHEAATLFAEAVRANSNLEMDWLWLSTQVAGSYERGYCLRKALEINPSSEIARRELASLFPEGSGRR